MNSQSSRAYKRTRFSDYLKKISIKCTSKPKYYVNWFHNKTKRKRTKLTCNIIAPLPLDFVCEFETLSRNAYNDASGWLTGVECAYFPHKVRSDNTYLRLYDIKSFMILARKLNICYSILIHYINSATVRSANWLRSFSSSKECDLTSLLTDLL